VKGTGTFTAAVFAFDGLEPGRWWVMKRSDAFFWGGMFGFAALVIAAYKLEHPKCPKCDAALQALAIGQRVVCPRCLQTVSALQALLA